MVSNGTNSTAEVSIPILYEEELSHGALAMVFTAIAGVVMYALEPIFASALLFTTLGIAVYTTHQPGTRAWDLYQRALDRPLHERIEMFQEALDLAPRNDQVAFALALSLKESGRYSEALEMLRALEKKRPGDAAVEASLLATSRMLLTQAGVLRP